MKRILTILSFSIVFLSCNSNKSEKEKEAPCEKPKEEFQMYEISEMAGLMEQMYVENKRLRDRIINNDTLGTFPNYFLKIEKATFTKGKERDAFFNEQAQLFLKAQSEIYTAKDSKVAYNTMVDQCIACHEVKCGGPIMRIKKLYIK